VNLQQFNRWLLQQNGFLFLPRYNCGGRFYEFARYEAGNELVCGKYNLPEPDEAAALWCPAHYPGELWYLVPALAFDAAGNRLGLLEAASGKIIGVGYECQCSGAILPTEAHDHKMDLIITEKGLRVIS
ncbi:MAG: 5-formyltetrahydrofolate cyclo-ligase, partial [Victivallaceae bacterium]